MMPREFNRSERVAGQIRRELAKVIQMELRDPEIGFISLSDVEVTRDLAHAKVFITVFENEKAASTIKALQQAAKFLRHRLSQEMRIRSVPQLHFHHDASVETGQKMDQLIDQALSSDRAAPADENPGDEKPGED
jgi:ribosome-binding factor A